MKRYIGKYLMLLGGLLALAPMSGCKLDDPEIPVEELYLRNFIKQYGLIDPTQDFSSAVQSSVTLNVPSRASVANVYAQVGDEYYRVGCFADIEGEIKVPVDISKATEILMVDIDGVRYYTSPNGIVYAKSKQLKSGSESSTITSDYATLKSLWIEPEDWNTVTKINGETNGYYETLSGDPRRKIIINKSGIMSAIDDVPGGIVNDPVSDSNNPSVKDGYFNVQTAAYVGENLNKGTRNVKLGDHSHPGEVGNTSDGSNVRFLIKNNDDALSAYRFSFRTASKNDAGIRVALLGQHKSEADKEGIYVFMDSYLEIKNNQDGTANSGTYDTGIDDMYTEWELRTDLLPKGYYELIIMGVDSKRNPDGNQYCGNWGYMKIEKIKTAKDMRWILACEDLGTTDDFDFNDVVLSIEAVNTNTAAIDLGVIGWQVIEDTFENGGTVIHKAPSRSYDPNSKIQTQLTVTALAAGGTLPIWLHFREDDKIDYLVCPKYDDGKRGCLREASVNGGQEASLEESNADLDGGCNEWHRWFGETSSVNMLNTGLASHRDGKSVTFYTNKPFSLENFCYLKFETDGKDGDFPFFNNKEDVNLDPWAQKVLEWKWQQEHSQEVTYGFFLTVYKPTVTGSNTEIKNKDDNFAAHLISKSLEGLPPQMFLIPDCDPLQKSGYIGENYGWKWPCERVNITAVYPNFKRWVESAYEYPGSSWFMLPNPGIVDNDRKLYPRNPEDQKKYVPFSLSGTTSDTKTEK